MTINKNSSFPLTSWTRIAWAGNPSHPRVQVALAELFQLYWYPIYAFIRRSGFNEHDAEDLTQGFFLYACQHHIVRKADETKGRFRTFMLACLKNFLNDAHDHRTAVKRGGPEVHVPFDGLTAEARYAAEPFDELTPDKIFERRLASEILDGAMNELESEASREGKHVIFDSLRGNLDGDGIDERYADISVRLNMPLGTVKSHAKRFRDRLRELLTERVDHLVASVADVKSEMVALEESL